MSEYDISATVPSDSSSSSSESSSTTPTPTATLPQILPYEAQIRLQTLQINKSPSDPALYLRRSISYQQRRPPNFLRAYTDASYAVRLATLGGIHRNPGLAAEAQLRRAIALDSIGRSRDALGLLKAVKASGVATEANLEGVAVGKWKYFVYWVDMIEAKIRGGEGAWNSTDIPLLPGLPVLSHMFGVDPEGELEYHLTSAGGAVSTVVPIANLGADSTTAATTKAPPKPASKAEPSIRHEWYQNAQSVSLTLFAKGIDKDAAKIKIEENSIHISFVLNNNTSPKTETETEYSRSFDPLFAPIDTTKSTFRITPLKVEFSLVKSVPGQKWPALEGDISKRSIVVGGVVSTTTPTGTTATAVSSMNPTPLGYPTAPAKFGTKDWDAILNTKKPKPKSTPTTGGESSSANPPLPQTTTTTTKTTDETLLPDPSDPNPKSSSTSTTTATAATTDSTIIIDSLDEYDDEAEEEAEANGSVDAFFKQLYSKADPDTRRAMMKSFVESNGTSLSTNWKEVGKGPVETHPPEGTEVKKW